MGCLIRSQALWPYRFLCLGSLRHNVSSQHGGLQPSFAFADQTTAWPSLSADESCTEAIGRIRQDPCIHALCDCLLRYAPCAARKGSATFLQSIRFLIARFRVDYWWYGILSQLASFEAVGHFGQQMATLTGHSDGS